MEPCGTPHVCRGFADVWKDSDLIICFKTKWLQVKPALKNKYFKNQEPVGQQVRCMYVLWERLTSNPKTSFTTFSKLRLEADQKQWKSFWSIKTLRSSHRTWTQQLQIWNWIFLSCDSTTRTCLMAASGGRKTRPSLIGGWQVPRAAGRSLVLTPRGCHRGSWEQEGGGWDGAAGG